MSNGRDIHVRLLRVDVWPPLHDVISQQLLQLWLALSTVVEINMNTHTPKHSPTSYNTHGITS